MKGNILSANLCCCLLLSVVEPSQTRKAGFAGKNQNTRPESNLEKLLHELEKCDWKTTEKQKMRSRNAEQGQVAPKQREMSRHFEKIKLQLRE